MARPLPVSQPPIEPSASAAPKRQASSFYPIVLYITPAAKPTVNENVSYQFGATVAYEDAVDEMRKLAAALCASRGWHWKEHFKDKDVLWCYLWNRGGKEIIEKKNTVEEQEGLTLMGWWVAERVWIRRKGRDVGAEIGEFVSENLLR
jgi:hypothetical protein